MIDLIFSICNVIIIFSYFSKNILILRLLAILGSLGFVAGAFIAGYNLPGMTSFIVFSAVYIIVNTYQSLILTLDRVPIFLPENIKHIYLNNFQMMSPGEFNKIYKFSYLKKYKKNDILSVQGEPINELLIIIHGSTRVTKNSALIATLSSGDFIGEMSLIVGGPATASVVVSDEETECIVWEKEVLIRELHDQPQLYLKFKQALAADLVKKLNAAGLGA